jgi:hypothetical protein
MVTALVVQIGRTAAARALGLVVQVGRRPVGRRVVGLVFVVAVVRVWAGVWAAALVGAVVVTVGLLAGWAAVERRMSERLRAPVPALNHHHGRAGPGGLDGEHVAFARGLAGLAAWYLAEREQQEREALR